jgi:hypothetical protein
LNTFQRQKTVRVSISCIEAPALEAALAMQFTISLKIQTDGLLQPIYLIIALKVRHDFSFLAYFHNCKFHLKTAGAKEKKPP